MAKSKILFKKTFQKEQSFGKLPLLRQIILSTAINLIVISLVIIFFKNLPPEVPLFYGSAQGEAQLKSSIYLIVPGVTSLGITFFNIFIATLLTNDYIRKILISTSLVISTLGAITTLKIMLLVGSF